MGSVSYISTGVLEQARFSRETVEGYVQLYAGRNGCVANVVRRLPNQRAFRVFVHSTQPGKLTRVVRDRIMNELAKEFPIVEVIEEGDQTQLHLRVGGKGTP